MKLNATLQKDYYGKAKIRIDGDYIILTSYNTDVAAINTKTRDFHRLWAGWSSTTAKHINDFRLQNGFEPINKKTWLELPCWNSEEVYNVYISNGFFTYKSGALLTAEECQKEVQKIKEHRPMIYTWYD